MEDMDKNRDGYVTVEEYISKSTFSIHANRQAIEYSKTIVVRIFSYFLAVVSIHSFLYILALLMATVGITVVLYFQMICGQSLRGGRTLRSHLGFSQRRISLETTGIKTRMGN